jgi:hypothetical protein
MRKQCICLLSLFLAATVFAQPRLTIDKLDREDIAAIAKEVSFSTLLEGTIENPDLAVYVLVREPNGNDWRSYPATVDGTRVDPAGGYRWRAICHFGGYDGDGVGLSYKVRVIAIDPERITPGNLLNSLWAASFQTGDITIKRVRK